MAREPVRRKVIECAEMLLGRARELTGSSDGVRRAASTVGAGELPWRAQLEEAVNWIPDECEEAACSAMFMTFGSIADQSGLDEILRLEVAADKFLDGSGKLLVFAVDDWFEHDENFEAIRDLGAETPEEIGADYWLYRWLDLQPSDCQTLLQAVEAVAACLSVVLDLLPNSDAETVEWWVGPEPSA
ncbi:hypothetical protein GCM10027020_12660 [Nocardioides salsibiostraticola]